MRGHAAVQLFQGEAFLVTARLPRLISFVAIALTAMHFRELEARPFEYPNGLGESLKARVHRAQVDAFAETSLRWC